MPKFRYTPDRKFNDKILNERIELLRDMIQEYYYVKLGTYEFRNSNDEFEIKRMINDAEKDIIEKFEDWSNDIDDEIENIEEGYYEDVDMERAKEDFIYNCQIGEEWK